MELLAQITSSNVGFNARLPVPSYDQGLPRTHGDRLRYKAGCRCVPCTEANTLYARQRHEARNSGEWNGLVDSSPAQAHLLDLNNSGVTVTEICTATNISSECVTEILKGDKVRIRASTERAILAVEKGISTDLELVNAAVSCDLIAEMIAGGFSKQRIAHELGGSIQHVVPNAKITVRKARLIRDVRTLLLTPGDAQVSSAPTLRLIRELRTEYFTSQQIARHMGISTEELLIIGDTVSNEFAGTVKFIHAQLMN